MEYTAVIRTLGTAGDKYQQLLNSLDSQTIQPSEIIVYIAEGYPIPKETIGKERYVYVKKGMVAQRALPYNEVKTEYILALDDDLYLPNDTVEKMYSLLTNNNADVISPDIFPNAERPFKAELMMTLSGRMMARRGDNKYGYKVMRNAGYSYNKNPQKDVLLSQTNAGAMFLCKKDLFRSINFQDELWLDESLYPLGEDQVMYYKMYKKGAKILTWYKHQVKHLDGGGNLNPEKEKRLIYSDFRFKTIFWHRFIYLPEKNILFKIWNICCITYALLFTLVISLIKLEFPILKIKWNAIKDGISFINSKEYKTLPRI